MQLQHTVEVYLVGKSAADAQRNAPFFNMDEADDYRADHGGEVFTAEAEVIIDQSTVQEA